MDVNFDALTTLPNNYDYFNNNAANGTIFAIMAGVVIIYYLIFSSLGVAGVSGNTENTSGRSGSSVILEILIWSSFILLLIFNGLQYFFSINVKASIKNLFTSQPEVDLVIDQPVPISTNTDEIIESTTVPEITNEYQVFHVSDNKYTYDDAKAICKAYGGRLATYDEIEESYKAGGEWCGFGWSEDQMALYPTQKKTWEKLQKIKGHKHDCGRPGVNGGYISNPNVKFGVNCYGYKPKATPSEIKKMRDAPLYPVTQQEIDFKKNVKKWESKLPTLEVSPFNHSEWSKP